jgi:hypothetical protein
MREDSPTQFVRFKRKKSVYERGLELVRHVHAALDHISARPYLKDRLDRRVTGIVIELGRAEGELPSQRWRNYRRALQHANDCKAELDIIAAQQTTVDERLATARITAGKLCDELTKLALARAR